MAADGAEPGQRRMERRRLLANVSIFSTLDAAALDALLELTSIRRLPARAVLFRKGESGHQLYGVIEGRLRVSASGSDGKEVVFTYSDPGDVIGDIAILDSKPRSATVEAVTDCELLTLDRRDLLPFLERQPRVSIQLAQLLAARVRRLSEAAEDAAFLGLPPRLAKTLLALSRSYGAEVDDGVRIEMKLPQQELADMLGVTRESINKQLRLWQKNGQVTAAAGQITLRDIPALEACAKAGIL